MDPSARKPRSREQIDNHIRQTARDLARQEGWSAVSIRKIADAISFSAPVVYDYFDSKDALLAAVREESLTTLLDAFRRIQKLYRDPEKQLYEISLSLWQYAVEQPELYDLIYNQNGACCAHPLTQSAAHTAIGELIRAVLFTFIPKSDQSLHKLYLEWWATAHGLIVVSLLLRPDRPLTESELLYREVMRRFARNLR